MRDDDMSNIFNDDVALKYIGLAFCTGYILREAYVFIDEENKKNEKKEEEK